MRQFISTNRRLLSIAGGIWLAGLAVIWWLMPVGPRDGWQPPANENICGFLKDNRTLVTAARDKSPSATVSTETGPVHLWDIETGQLVASLLDTNDRALQGFVVAKQDLLAFQQQESLSSSGGVRFHLRIRQARSGDEVLAIDSKIALDQAWWAINDDATIIAYVNSDSGGPRVEWRELASGKLLHTFAGWQGPICFSKDGNRFAAYKPEDKTAGTKWEMAVWDVPTGREIAMFTESFWSLNMAWPISFSPDGSLLLDSYGRVWDVASNQKRFQVAESEHCTTTFNIDGRYLIQERRIGFRNWLTFWNVTKGEEEKERRTLLDGRPNVQWRSLSWATPDGRLLVAKAMEFVAESKWREFLNRLPGVRLRSPSNYVPVCTLVDPASGREIQLGDVRGVHCSPDGRVVVTLGPDGGYQIWDIPPRKPLRWLLPAFAIWSALIALLTWWRSRGSRVVIMNASQRETAPAPTQGEATSA